LAVDPSELHNHSPLSPPAPLLVCWPSNTFFSTSNVRITSWFPYCFQRIFFIFFSCQLLHGKIDSRHFYTCCCHMCLCIQVCSMSGGLSAD
jgi:hypothetical protein